MTLRLDICAVRAGGPQLPADQPHSAAAADALHGLVQPDRAAARARSVDRALAVVLRSGSERGAKNRVPQHARLLHPRAQGRRAAGRSAIRRSWSAHAMRSSAPAGAIAGTELFRSRAFPTRLSGSAGRHRSGRAPSRRPLRHAAADLEHVPPLPRAARLPRRAGDLHFRRYLERQSDRAEARSRSCSARTSAP